MYPEALLYTLNSDFRQPLDIPPLDGFIMTNALHFIVNRARDDVARSEARLQSLFDRVNDK